MHLPFFNSSATIESAPDALLFQCFFYFLMAWQINVNLIISEIDWKCLLLQFGAFVEVFLKMFTST
jgi:hypothetical protein